MNGQIQEWIVTGGKYLMVLVVFFFMYSIIRMIYLDIKKSRMGTVNDDRPYIKLLNRRHSLSFQVEELYSVQDRMTLGRGLHSDITIRDPYLSTLHIQFLEKEGQWYVLDNKSTNGTEVNGNYIKGTSSPLKTGDLIRLGQLQFIFMEPTIQDEE